MISPIPSAYQSLVLDASVTINLLASGMAESVLKALSCTVYIEPTTRAEVSKLTGFPSAVSDLLAALEAKGLLIQRKLIDAEIGVFFDLAGADAPDDLDDGEAAAIALAQAISAAVEIDERKGRRIFRGRYADLHLTSSLEIFCDERVVEGLSWDNVTDAIKKALLVGRMRVFDEYDEEVRELIGHEFAGRCPSLKKRKRSPSVEEVVACGTHPPSPHRPPAPSGCR